MNFDSTTIQNIAGLLVALGVGGSIGAWVTHRLDQNAENKRKVREAKEQQYKSLLTNILGFFEGWEDYEAKDKRARKKQFMWEVYTSAPVYASDEVLKLCHQYIKGFEEKRSSKENDKIYAQLVLAIRKELNKIQGQPDTGLSEKDFIISKLDE